MANQPLPAGEYPVIDLLVAIGTKIKTSAAINEWCLLSFGTEISVFGGVDFENPPGADECPMVEIFPVDTDDGMEMKAHERALGVRITVHDKEQEPTTYQGLSFQRGLLRAEELYGLVLTAIFAADLQDGYVDSVGSHRPPETPFPFFQVIGVLKIKKNRWPFQI